MAKGTQRATQSNADPSDAELGAGSISVPMPAKAGKHNVTTACLLAFIVFIDGYFAVGCHVRAGAVSLRTSLRTIAYLFHAYLTAVAHAMRSSYLKRQTGHRRHALQSIKNKGMKLLWGGSEPTPFATRQQPLYAGSPEKYLVRMPPSLKAKTAKLVYQSKQRGGKSG